MPPSSVPSEVVCRPVLRHLPCGYRGVSRVFPSPASQLWPFSGCSVPSPYRSFPLGGLTVPWTTTTWVCSCGSCHGLFSLAYKTGINGRRWTGTVFSCLVGAIDRVGCKTGDFLAEKQPDVLYGGYPPCPLVEGVERDMFYEVDPVHLYQVGLCTKTPWPWFPCPVLSADIVLVDAHDLVRHRLSCIYFCWESTSPMMLRLLWWIPSSWSFPLYCFSMASSWQSSLSSR